MKIVIQRVQSAKVEVEERLVGVIDEGLLIFLGIGREDTKKDADLLLRKVIHLRIFENDKGKMMYSVLEKEGGILLVSQFTLYGNCLKGRRPSFEKAASPEYARPLYDYCIKQMQQTKLNIQTGEFQSMMKVSLVNNGPVTLSLDSKE